MKKITLILPFRLPTWNQLLAMNHWQRKKVRDWIKDVVSTCIQEQKGSLTKMGVVLRPQLTDLEKAVYLRMITPNSLRGFRNRKKEQRKDHSGNVFVLHRCKACYQERRIISKIP